MTRVAARLAVTWALLRLKQAIESIPEESPRDAHQPNGVVEHAVDEFKGMVRTLNDALGFCYKLKLPSNHPIYTWMVN